MEGLFGSQITEGKKLCLSVEVHTFKLPYLLPDGTRENKWPGWGKFDCVDCFSEAVRGADGVNGGKAALCDGLDYIDNSLQLLTVLSRAAPKSNCDATRQYAFCGASVEVCKSHWNRAQQDLMSNQADLTIKCCVVAPTAYVNLSVWW